MDRLKQAVVLCGGRGTRLRPYTDHIPKPMVSCNEKPFLWYLLQQMSDQGIREFVLLTGYLGGNIENYFGDGGTWGWDIQYSEGPVDWDTGKRVWEAREKLDELFLLLYSDNFVPFPLDKVYALHKHNQKPLTFMVASKTPGNISLDKFGIVQQYDNKRFGLGLNYVEIGYMIVEKNQTLSFFDIPECSFSSILQKMADKNQISAWVQHDSYHSISDPKRWQKAQEYLKPKKIILIDRDGVINKKASRGEYISKWEDFIWIKETRIAMKLMANEGFKFIIISNQAGIARGVISFTELEKIHNNMKNELQNDDIEILDIYICPHHWNEECFCRKPKPGMLLRASKDHLFRLDKTLYIGDDPRDVEAALNAGTDYILISEEKTNIDNHDNFVDIKSYFSLVEALDTIKAKLS